MKRVMYKLFSLILTMALCLGLARAQTQANEQEPSSILLQDARLQSVFSVSNNRIRIRQLLHDVSKKTEIDLRAEDKFGTRSVQIHLEHKTILQFMDSLAMATNGYWEKSGKSYLLRQNLPPFLLQSATEAERRFSLKMSALEELVGKLPAERQRQLADTRDAYGLPWNQLPENIQNTVRDILGDLSRDPQLSAAVHWGKDVAETMGVVRDLGSFDVQFEATKHKGTDRISYNLNMALPNRGNWGMLTDNRARLQRDMEATGKKPNVYEPSAFKGRTGRNVLRTDIPADQKPDFDYLQQSIRGFSAPKMPFETALQRIQAQVPFSHIAEVSPANQTMGDEAHDIDLKAVPVAEAIESVIGAFDVLDWEVRSGGIVVVLQRRR